MDVFDTSYLHMIVTVICSVMASSGFWAFIQRRHERKDVRTQMLIGLGHDRIVFLGMGYVERGWITQDEYENLHEYLYKPYEAMGGNGSAKRVMDEVKRLPIKQIPPHGFKNLERRKTVDEINQ